MAWALILSSTGTRKSVSESSLVPTGGRT